MKFTKLTSSVLAGATLLAILAPTTTAFAATATGDLTNNGNTPLPQPDTTVAGISFGDNTNNGNTGYLRLQMVPHTLDFGNHTLLNSQYRQFDATGANVGLTSNDRHAGYDNTDANKTATLNTGTAVMTDDAVKGTAWATVVDKQDSRDSSAIKEPGKGEGTDNVNGTWKLAVKSAGALTSANGDKLDNGVLTFKNGLAANTPDVFKLTSDSADEGYAPTATPKPVAFDAANKSSISLDLSAAGTPDQTIATAAAGEGAGANVFGWKPSDITLTLPKTATAAANTTYTANLTWTLSSGLDS